MPRRLRPSAEAVVWILCLLAVAVLLVVSRFASDDPDSALYASLSARLAAEPPSRWIAPEWWGNWESTGLFREHPVGVFLLPTILGRVGLPAAQAAYVVGVAAGLGSVLLIGVLVQRLTSRDEARAALVLLMIMPVAFIFRIRANHEYPMLVCLLATLVALDGVRQSWRWLGLVAVALTFALLVKGVFVVLVLLAAVFWVVLNPTEAPGSGRRPLLALAASLAIMAGVAAVYDAQYLRVTGERFWGPYWQRQLGPLTIATPIEGASTLLHHLLFYVSRVLWHPAPWSLALLAAGWKRRRDFRAWWRRSPRPARRGLLFAIGFASVSILVLSPSSRFAERYAFFATYAIGTAGAVIAYRSWPVLRTLIDRLDRSIPAFPATVWLALMLLRLALGPVLPRV